MIGIGSSLLFDRRSGKGGSPIPPFNDAMVDAWFMSGLSNNDSPSSIRGVKGNEMALKNFAYALSSGFGKYEIDFNSWTKNVNAANFTNSDSVIHLTEILVADSKFLQTSVDATISSYKVKVEGITDDIKLRYVSYAEDGTEVYTYLKNGINDLPISYKKFTGFAASVVGSCNITITQLPTAYEGALVFDGVDDYGICTGLPILDDYTVVCKREIINKETGSVASKRTSSSQWNGAFIFERNNQLTSFGQNNYRTIQQNNVSYMTTTSYNGNTISRGSLQDTEYLVLGADGFNIDLNRAHGFSNCAIYYFALYNKSLTPEEIETEKERLNEEWLKRSKVTIPEPDVYYDLSLKDNSSPTRNIIDDLSGNGHDAEIFNAAYTESSGYRSDGAFVFDGVDDLALMKNVKKGFKTLFMEVVPMKIGGMMYDQRISTADSNFGIYNGTGQVAYNSKNNGENFINGKINSDTIYTNDLVNKRTVVTVVNGEESNCKVIAIASTFSQGVCCNMALYKLIGFYDELTPLQIEKVINDYKLKYD